MSVERIFDAAARSLPDECWGVALDVSLVLGSGWGDSLEIDRMIADVPYDRIVGFGPAAVKGHAGRLKIFERMGKRVLAFCGRHHWYEGRGWDPVVLPVEIARRMGVKKILLTNAAGGIAADYRPGDLAIITDHINAFGLNPLIGPLVEGWGERFPDLSEVYSPYLAGILRGCAKRRGISLKEGIYCFTPGPVYETPAEIRAYKAMGANLVGMSTVPEAIVARACGMQVAAVSLITNMAAGISAGTLSHEEVLSATSLARGKMVALVDDFVGSV